jgi:hypothetical protein
MDVRTHQRWGVGAELLMRGKSKAAEPSLFVHDDADGYLDYSDEGFRLARQYYERLIVQYPPDPRRVGTQASTFYMAMFSLWIYEVSERYKNGTPASRGPSRSSKSPVSDRSGNSSPSSRRTSVSGDDNGGPQLHDVDAIAKRMDDILETLLFDRNAELLEMRGMVELWIVDLANWTGKKHEESMIRAAGWFQRAQENGIDLTSHAMQVVQDYYDEEVEEDEVVEEETEDEAMEDEDTATG